MEIMFLPTNTKTRHVFSYNQTAVLTDRGSHTSARTLSHYAFFVQLFFPFIFLTFSICRDDVPSCWPHPRCPNWSWSRWPSGWACPEWRWCVGARGPTCPSESRESRESRGVAVTPTSRWSGGSPRGQAAPSCEVVSLPSLVSSLVKTASMSLLSYFWNTNTTTILILYYQEWGTECWLRGRKEGRKEGRKCLI